MTTKNALRALLLAVVMALPLGAYAEVAQQLVLTLTDKSTQTFWLKDEPKIVFGATDLTITAGEVTFQVERSQVKTFTFNEAETEGVNVIGTITSNVPSAIYDLNGRLVQQGELNVNLLPPGHYVLQAPGQKAVKILKK